MIFFACFALLLAGASAHHGHKHVCPNVTVTQDFQLSNFTGMWYKQYGMNTPWDMGSCVWTNVTMGSGNDTSGDVQLDTAFKMPNFQWGMWHASAALVDSSSNSTEGIFNVTMGTKWGDLSSDMLILSTDYESYAIAYTCRNIRYGWWSEAVESVSVMTRLQSIELDTYMLIMNAMTVLANQGGPNIFELQPVQQNFC